MSTATVSVVVLTRNEERNLRACLESVAGWAQEIFVVDSGSTDATLMIARQFDAKIATHPFDTHAAAVAAGRWPSCRSRRTGCWRSTRISA